MPYYMVDLMEPVTVKDHENSVAAGAVVEWANVLEEWLRKHSIQMVKLRKVCRR